MFRTLTSNSPFSAPRDDTARASCGNGAKANSYHFQFVDTRAGREGRQVHGDKVSEFPGQFLDDIQVSLVCNVPIR